MLVVDASALAEYLVGNPLGERAADAMAPHQGDLHVPHLAYAEVMSVLRSWVARGEMRDERAAAAVDDLADFPAARYASEPLLARIWQLRANVTANDAHYVALAEALGCPLLTADARIARASGHHVEVLLLS